MKFVHSFVPEDFKQSIYIINKKELNNYIDPNQLPNFLDGTCELSYKAAPQDVSSAHVLAEQLKISKSAADKLTKHLQPHILDHQITI